MNHIHQILQNLLPSPVPGMVDSGAMWLRQAQMVLATLVARDRCTRYIVDWLVGTRMEYGDEKNNLVEVVIDTALDLAE